MVINPFCSLLRERKMSDTFHFEGTTAMALLCWDIVRNAIMIQEYMMKIKDALEDFRVHAGEEYEASVQAAQTDWQQAKENQRNEALRAKSMQEGTLAGSS